MLLHTVPILHIFIYKIKKKSWRLEDLMKIMSTCNLDSKNYHSRFEIDVSAKNLLSLESSAKDDVLKLEDMR